MPKGLEVVSKTRQGLHSGTCIQSCTYQLPRQVLFTTTSSSNPLDTKTPRTKIVKGGTLRLPLVKESQAKKAGRDVEG